VSPSAIPAAWTGCSMIRSTGFRTSGLRRIPLRRALEGIAETGYDAVEFCLEHPGASSGGIDCARSLGLSVSAVSYHGKKDPAEERLRQGRRAVELAAGSGVPVVVLGSPLESEYAFRREAEELYKLCRDAGLKPAWETEPGTVLASLAEFGRMIAPLGDAAGINLDAGHLHLDGDCTAEELRRLAGRIHHVHVEGMRSGRPRHLVPGEGDLDWHELLSGLGAAGYGGPLTVDLFELPEDWMTHARRANVELRRIMEEFEARSLHAAGG